MHITYRSFKLFDQSLFQADMYNSDLIYVVSYSDTNVALTKLFNTVHSVLSGHFTNDCFGPDSTRLFF